MVRLRRHSTPLALFATTFALYVSTLAPGMLRGDSGEFQWAMVSLNVAHATGYPLFTLIGNLWQYAVPFGGIAFRLNLLAAISGALAVAFVYQFAFTLTRHVLPALAGAIFLALAPTFWFNSSILEVYSLNAFFLVAIIFLAWLWAQEPIANYPLLVACFFLLGLALAHHRLTLLVIPALALYIVWNDRELLTDWRDVAYLILALVPGLALYLFVVLRLAQVGQPWQYALNDIILGRQFQASLFREFRPFDVFVKIPLDNFHIGLAFALIGAVVSFRRDVKLATFLTFAYALDAMFAFIYWVPDVEVFLTPGFLVIAIWIAVGVNAVTEWAQARFAIPQSLFSRGMALAALVLALLALSRWNEIKGRVAVETSDVEKNARALLSANLPTNALLELDWETATAIRFLQTTERLRTDLEARLIHLERRDEYFSILHEVDRRRPVFLDPGVNLARFDARYRGTRGAGDLWRLENTREVATFVGTPVNENLQLTALEVDDRETVLLWKVVRPLGGNYATFIHYFDADGRPLGQQDKAACCEPLFAYATSEWEANMLIADYFRALPDETTYLRLGLYDKDQNDELIPYGDTIYLQTRPLSLEDMETPSDADFGDLITLRGYTLAREGERVKLKLFWESNTRTQTDYTIFVHALDATGKIIARVDRQPLAGLYPTHAWRVAEIVRDTYEFQASSGIAKWSIGLYDASNGARLKRADGNGEAVEIEVK